MVDDSLKPVGLINTTRLIEPRKDRTAKDWAGALLEAAVNFAVACVERSIKRVSKRPPSRQRIVKDVSALLNSGCLERTTLILMRDIRKVMKAEGVHRMDETTRSIAYQIAIRQLKAETKSMRRPPGRPRKQTERSNLLPISSPKRRRSISTEERELLIGHAAGVYLRFFISRNSRTLLDDRTGALGFVRSEEAIEEVMAGRAISYAARSFVKERALDPNLTKSLEKHLARNKRAIRQFLSDRLARR